MNLALTADKDFLALLREYVTDGGKTKFSGAR